MSSHGLEWDHLGGKETREKKELIIKVILMFSGWYERAGELARQTESNINAKYSTKNELKHSEPGRDWSGMRSERCLDFISHVMGGQGPKNMSYIGFKSLNSGSRMTEFVYNFSCLLIQIYSLCLSLPICNIRMTLVCSTDCHCEDHMK